MNSLRIFGWWFMLGALMALAVILIQGGIRDIMLAEESIWDSTMIELLTPVLGGGILGGCIALILNRLRESNH